MSSVIELLPWEKPLAEKKICEIMKFVRAGFSSRRKQLHHNLAAGRLAASKSVKNFLLSMNLNPQARAQELTTDDWIALVKNLKRSEN